MAVSLEDGDKKSGNVRDILDLSHVTISSEQELKKILEKIPDFRIRPEKVRREDVEFKDVEDQDATATGVAKTESDSYAFADPMPLSMRNVNIRELGRVNISWRMLTMSRPKTKNEEEIFNRLVQLEKLQHQTIKWENDVEARKGAVPAKSRSSSRVGRAEKSHRGGVGAPTRTAVTEVRRQTCQECGEEFCGGACKKYLYDDHARTLNPPSNDEIFKTTVTTRKVSIRRAGAPKTSVPEEDDDDDQQRDAVAAAVAPVADEKKITSVKTKNTKTLMTKKRRGKHK